MPNWVYSNISIHSDVATEKQKEILKHIEEVGICEHYLPMPSTLNITEGSSIQIARKILKDESGEVPEEYNGDLTETDFKEARQSFINERSYGFRSWYDWKNHNYGTKWGDVDCEVYDDNFIQFKSAWSPLNLEIIEKLSEDFPNFNYEWEEETGFGEEYESIDGELSQINAWDSPEIEEIELDDSEYIWKLESPYKGFKIGYYSDCIPDEYNYLGETLEEALSNVK
ncbi:MAG: hypothetical protein LBM02_09690 [Lachnospiraceae bacterium]|jgi:hypothetical protein|nr:hypothetical protein [Lachnospiraceae bacterium]